MWFQGEPKLMIVDHGPKPLIYDKTDVLYFPLSFKIILCKQCVIFYPQCVLYLFETCCNFTFKNTWKVSQTTKQIKKLGVQYKTWSNKYKNSKENIKQGFGQNLRVLDHGQKSLVLGLPENQPGTPPRTDLEPECKKPR